MPSLPASFAALAVLAAVAACGSSQRPAPACPVCADDAADTVAATDPTPATPAEPARPRKPPPVAVTPGGTITVAVLPAPAYVERSDAAQLVNCDLRIENASERDYQLTAIEVAVFDRKGTLSWRKRIDDNGVSPGITTVPNRALASGARVLLLNPVHTFPADLELARLTFELTFSMPEDDTPSSDDPQWDPVTVTAEVAPTAYTNVARFRVPVAGRLLVWDGHDFLSHHRRWDYDFEPIREFGFKSNAARYSYDLVPVDDQGAMSKGDTKDNASWFGFGQPVHAPAAGKIIGVVSATPDDRSFDIFALKENLQIIYGNHVLIDHGNDEISMLAHLKQNSVTVKIGDTVTAGQVIAQIGASGSAMFPHLHYQLQNAPDANAEGLPSYFHDFTRVRGARRTAVKRGQIDSGDVVDSAAPKPAKKRAP